MARLPADWLRPDWQVDSLGVGALMTTRRGGVSRAPFDSLNLAAAVGDEPAAVARNRQTLADAIGAPPVLLRQVHGAEVVRLTAADARSGAPVHRADASVTTETGLACAVQVADCLPVLFAASDGSAVGAAHAGWRGLAAGVLEATLAAVCAAAGCPPREVLAWLGASIGPAAFEVGSDVLEAFGAAPGMTPGMTPRTTGAAARFRPGAVPGKWLADLPGLARDRLHAAGALRTSGGGWCTVSDASRFFSFRRDGITGRSVAAVWRR